MTGLIGSIGMGLVWGWLLGGRVTARRSEFLFVVAATLVPIAEVQIVTGWPGPALFIGSTVIAGWGYVAWRRALWTRYGPSI